jgi:hypothetical protein
LKFVLVIFMRLASLFLVLVLATVSNCAQSPAHGQPSTALPLTADTAPWPSVGLNLLFFNETNSSEPVPNLSGIQVVEDRVPQSIESVLGPQVPISLCFLIDDSGSTLELSRSIAGSVAAIAHSLPPESEIAVIHFADHAFLDLPFTLADKVDPKILSIGSHRGGTALYDALVATVDYSQQHAHYRRRAIVLVTDGEDNASTLNLDQTLKRMGHPSGPILYALFFHGNDMSRTELRHGGRVLEILVNTIGGLVFRPVEQKDVHPIEAAIDAAVHLAAAMHGQIVVTYKSTNPSQDQKPRKVEVTLPQSSLEIRFQHDYWATGWSPKSRF